MENKIVTRLYLFIPSLPPSLPWILSRPILVDVFTAFRRRNEWAYTFCRMNRPFYRAESFLAFRRARSGRSRAATSWRRRRRRREEDGCKVYTFFFRTHLWPCNRSFVRSLALSDPVLPLPLSLSLSHPSISVPRRSSSSSVSLKKYRVSAGTVFI